MRNGIFIAVMLSALFSCDLREKEATSAHVQSADTLIVKLGIADDRISKEWQGAIARRMNHQMLDSMVRLSRPVTNEEQKWIRLIESKAGRWNEFRDSLAVPFQGIGMSDTIYTLLGYQGVDDGFTYKFQTVCFDVTALHRAYGSADLPVNDNRIDRLFAHEYTHLIHKVWADKENLRLASYRDSILWECLYEGIGMYRSLSARWFPLNDSLPVITNDALHRLYPIFTERLTAIENSANLTMTEKIRLHSNLSRGAVANKWGALPVAIWLALEAEGDDTKLIPWIQKGPEGVIQLARKYLDEENRRRFEAIFSE